MKESVLHREFVRSLKSENAEEVIDVYFYRPVAFVLAKALEKTRITPNVITLSGIFWGLLAGYFLSKGSVSACIIGAIIYQIANIFDCADGQLARLKSIYSDFGRILDGFVDYVNVSVVYIGSYIGLFRSRDNFLSIHHIILIMLFASLSTIFASVIYDKLKSKYMNLSADKDVVKEDRTEIRKKINAETSAAKKLFYILYLFYLNIQSFITENISLRGRDTVNIVKANREKYRELYITRNSKLLRVWSLVGPSTHAFYFLIFALFGKVSWYFLFISGPLNIILLILFYIQYRTEKNILVEIQSKKNR